MSGHSKWSSIKRKKAVTDAKRGQHFTKLIREITVAARSGGGSLEGNHRLRLAIDTAKAANMPGENIERAIKKGTGELEGVTYQEVVYEGYGPGGVAIYLEVVTDNGNRTVAALRHMLERNGGSLGASGSVAWQFDRKGQVFIEASLYDEDRVLEVASEAGAEDFAHEGSEYRVTCDISVFQEVQEGLGRAGIESCQAEIAMIPRAEVDVAGRDGERLIKLLGVLEDHDDVQRVYTNGNIDEELLAEVG